MTNTIQEIAKNASEAATMAANAAQTAQGTNATVAKLGQSSAAIGEVIKVITSIAQQTNLLALNATIATAVEQQNATTNEMTRNVADAAKGSGEIAHNIEGVAQAAESTSTSAQESEKAANGLAEMAVQLRTLVSQFKIHSTNSAAQHPSA